MNWVKIFVNIYCYLNGFLVKKLTTKSELKVAFDLKNEVNQKVSGLKPLPEKEEFMYPEGLAVTFGLFAKEQLIGTIQLMDLTQIESYTSKVYAKITFDYEPQETYEIKSFVVDPSYQHGIGSVFNMLIYYCIVFTQETKRKQWLVVTRNTFYEKIKKRSGLPTTFIADECHYLEDDTIQSKYFRNYEKDNVLKGCTCYYIHIPKRILSNLAVKFIKMLIIKTFKKLNITIPNFQFSK
jgi:hypothetical protein